MSVFKETQSVSPGPAETVDWEIVLDSNSMSTGRPACQRILGLPGPPAGFLPLAAGSRRYSFPDPVCATNTRTNSVPFACTKCSTNSPPTASQNMSFGGKKRQGKRGQDRERLKQKMGETARRRPANRPGIRHAHRENLARLTQASLQETKWARPCRPSRASQSHHARPPPSASPLPSPSPVSRSVRHSRGFGR
jgi:hypothetical protein